MRNNQYNDNAGGANENYRPQNQNDEELHVRNVNQVETQRVLRTNSNQQNQVPQNDNENLPQMQVHNEKAPQGRLAEKARFNNRGRNDRQRMNREMTPDHIYQCSRNSGNKK